MSPSGADASSWAAAADTRYLYDGWNVIVEYDGATGNIGKRFTWGLDFSNLLQGAGGVGGLLACKDTKATAATGDDESYLYQYDANGNDTSRIDSASGAILARYDYDPYGNPLPIPGYFGPFTDDNPYRFSSKPRDSVTGLYYSGYRYYSAEMGRWVSRDPIEEDDQFNFYVGLQNSPASAIDRDGRGTASTFDALERWKWEQQDRLRRGQTTTTQPVTTQPATPKPDRPIDGNRNISDYNCAGLAFRNYL